MTHARLLTAWALSSQHSNILKPMPGEPAAFLQTPVGLRRLPCGGETWLPSDRERGVPGPQQVPLCPWRSTQRLRYKKATSCQTLLLNGPSTGGACSHQTLTQTHPSSALRHNTYRMFSQSEQSVDLVQAKTNRPTDNKTRD